MTQPKKYVAIITDITREYRDFVRRNDLDRNVCIHIWNEEQIKGRQFTGVILLHHNSPKCYQLQHDARLRII